MWFIDIIKNLFTSSSNVSVEKKFNVWPYSIELVSFDAEKMIEWIKNLREVLWIWLKEAKDKLQNLPSSLMEWISKEDAENIKQELEKLWMKVEIKKVE